MKVETTKSHRIPSKLTFTLLTLAYLLSWTPIVAQPAAVFVRLVNSPRAVGMGSGALLLTDQESIFYNPSAMALYHLNANASATSPFGTAWIPILTDDFRLRSASLTYSFMRNQAKTSAFSLGLLFQRFSYGQVATLNMSGQPNGTSKPRDMAVGLTLGYAKTGAFKYGFGITTRYINSNLKGSGGDLFTNATASAILIDAAAMIEVPITGSKTEEKQVSLRASVLQTLIGSNLTFIQVKNADPSPKINQFGAALSAHWGPPNLRSMSLLASAQLDRDVSGATNNLSATTRAGLEVGFYEMVYGRIGAFSSDSGEPLLKSFGAGFSLNGFLKLIHHNQLDATVANNDFPFWRSVDVRFDYAKIRTLNNLAISGTKFWKVSIAWRR